MTMRYTPFLALALLAAGMAPAAAVEADKPHQLVDEAVVTVETLLRDKQIGPNLASALAKARGVLIVPALIKGGFIVGGAGGSGVLLARMADGGWSSPAFITIGEASIGLQIGGSVSEVMLVVNTEKGLNSILRRKLTLGANVEIAVGPIGAGMGAQTTAAVGADVWTYARSRGLFAGGAFDGAYIEPREDWNLIYYGQRVGSKDITTNPSINNPHAKALRDALARPR